MLEAFQVLKFVFRSEQLSFENQWCDTEQEILESELQVALETNPSLITIPIPIHLLVILAAWSHPFWVDHLNLPHVAVHLTSTSHRTSRQH